MDKPKQLLPLELAAQESIRALEKEIISLLEENRILRINLKEAFTVMDRAGIVPDMVRAGPEWKRFMAE